LIVSPNSRHNLIVITENKSQYMVNHQGITQSQALLGYVGVPRVHALEQGQEFPSGDEMRRADVSAGGSWRLVEQEQRIGDIADVDDVPQLVPYQIRTSYTRTDVRSEHGRMHRHC
jgi:hypothetical protein